MNSHRDAGQGAPPHSTEDLIPHSKAYVLTIQVGQRRALLRLLRTKESDKHSPERIKHLRGFACSTQQSSRVTAELRSNPGKACIKSINRPVIICTYCVKTSNTSSRSMQGGSNICCYSVGLPMAKEQKKRQGGPFSCFFFCAVGTEFVEPFFFSFSNSFASSILDLQVATRVYHLRHGICKNQVAPPHHYKEED